VTNTQKRPVFDVMLFAYTKMQTDDMDTERVGGGGGGGLGWASVMGTQLNKA